MPQLYDNHLNETKHIKIRGSMWLQGKLIFLKTLLKGKHKKESNIVNFRYLLLFFAPAGECLL